MTQSNSIVLEGSSKTFPFLKWAGGKRWLTSSHESLFPSDFECYYEPFLGSGAVFFSLRPKLAVLSDINKDLIDCYSAVRDHWFDVQSLLTIHHNFHCTEYYYKIRSSVFEDLAARAARFIYLNRTCWNGLYRVNKNGFFNVPIGTKSNVILNTDDFQSVSKLLEHTQIVSKSFHDVIDLASKDDFIFADPPYTIKHNFNGFVKYNEQFFHWDDQVLLSDRLKEASNRGCKIMVTNANHPSVKELYDGFFDIIEVKRSSVIAASSNKRGIYEEIIIRNY